MTAQEDLKALFGKRLRDLRDRAGLSQQDVSASSGVSKVFYGTVERGEKAATLETIEKLARGLRVQPMDLFRFGPMEQKTDPSEKLGRKVASLAHGASPGRILGFETIARIYFESDALPRKRRARRKPR